MAEAVGREDARLIGIARREVPLPVGSRMEMLIGEPIDWPRLIAAARADVLVCALGTTMREAGSPELFRAVDHDLVRFCAEAAREAGIERMILVSSVAAEAGSGNFYLAVKGETEDALARLGFTRLDVLRPGLLRGRRQQFRPLEATGQTLAPLIDSLALHGRLRRFRSTRVRTVARAIFALAWVRTPGRYVHEHDGMQRLARGERPGSVSDRTSSLPQHGGR